MHCSWNTDNLISDPVYDKIYVSLTVSFITVVIIILIFSSVIAVVFMSFFLQLCECWSVQCLFSQFMLSVQCNLTKTGS